MSPPGIGPPLIQGRHYVFRGSLSDIGDVGLMPQFFPWTHGAGWSDGIVHGNGYGGGVAYYGDVVGGGRMMDAEHELTDGPQYRSRLVVRAGANLAGWEFGAVGSGEGAICQTGDGERLGGLNVPGPEGAVQFRTDCAVYEAFYQMYRKGVI